MSTKRKSLTLLLTLAMALGVCFLAVAGTTDKTRGGTSGYPSRFAGRTFLMERTLDFSSSSDTGTAAEVYQLFNIPAGSFVMRVSYSWSTGEDSTCTIDIGDGDDVDGYIDGANVQTGQTATACGEWTIGSTVLAAVTNVTLSTVDIPVLTNLTVTSVTTNTIVEGGGTNAMTYVSAITQNSYDSPGYLTNCTVETTSIYPVTTAPKPYVAGKMYTSADTIDMTLNNAADTLVITVRALVMPVSFP